MKKVFLTTALLLLAETAVLACTVCGKQQPKITRGLTHGAGPESNWDYAIAGGTVIIVALSLTFAVKWIIRPGEHERSHIKHSPFILD
jgi:hypothetical protein